MCVVVCVCVVCREREKEERKRSAHKVSQSSKPPATVHHVLRMKQVAKRRHTGHTIAQHIGTRWCCQMSTRTAFSIGLSIGLRTGLGISFSIGLRTLRTVLRIGFGMV